MASTPSETDSSDDSSNNSSDSDSGSQVSVTRSSGHQKDDSDDSEPDIKDQFLLPSFKPKPVMSTVSPWAKKTLRGPFLGVPMGKEERKGYVEDYFCSPSDYVLFSAPVVHDSPLALLHYSDSTAMLDLTRVHNDLLFAVRLGLLSYERVISVCSNWAKAYTHPISGKSTPEGPWASYDYKYKDGNVPCPIPHKIRADITMDSINELLARDFVVKANTPEEQMVALARWALSYKEGYDRQQAVMDEIHIEAFKFAEALKEVNVSTDIMRKDTGSCMRLLGSACQQIKAIREAKYTEGLDLEFKKFLNSKKKSNTPAQNMANRAGPLVDSDLVGQAKKYNKVKKAMEGVSKTKKRKEHTKLVVAAKKQAANNNRKPKKAADKVRKKNDKAPSTSNKFAAKKRIKKKKDKAKKESKDSE